jgi:hypothetical protein
VVPAVTASVHFAATPGGASSVQSTTSSPPETTGAAVKRFAANWTGVGIRSATAPAATTKKTP